MNDKKINKNLILVIVIGIAAIILVGGSYVLFLKEMFKGEQPQPPIEKKEAVLSVIGRTGQIGESVNLGINLKNPTGEDISALEFVLKYDKNVFASPTVKETEVLEKAGKGASFNVIEEGTMKVIVFGLNQNNIENGNLMDITFKIKNDAQPGISLIALEQVRAVNGQAEEVATKNESKSIEIIE